MSINTHTDEEHKTHIIEKVGKVDRKRLGELEKENRALRTMLTDAQNALKFIFMTLRTLDIVSLDEVTHTYYQNFDNRIEFMAGKKRAPPKTTVSVNDGQKLEAVVKDLKDKMKVDPNRKIETGGLNDGKREDSN